MLYSKKNILLSSLHSWSSYSRRATRETFLILLFHRCKPLSQFVLTLCRFLSSFLILFLRRKHDWREMLKFLKYSGSLITWAILYKYLKWEIETNLLMSFWKILLQMLIYFQKLNCLQYILKLEEIHIIKIIMVIFKLELRDPNCTILPLQYIFLNSPPLFPEFYVIMSINHIFVQFLFFFGSWEPWTQLREDSMDWCKAMFVSAPNSRVCFNSIQF